MTEGFANLSWADVSARRLARNGLVEPFPTRDPAEVVRTICAAHAQIPSAAELSIALRMEGATRTDVRDALRDRHSLIRMDGPRGTIHLLATKDLPMWVGALSSLPYPASPFAPDVRLDREQREQVVAAIGDALRNAELTVDELTEALVERVGPWAGDLVMPAFQVLWPRWRQATTLAAHRGLLCHGAGRGGKVTYTSPQRYLPGTPAEALDATTARARLVERYLHAYGPATPQHFARWLGAAPGWAVELFGAIEDRIERVDLDGEPAWVNAGDTVRPGVAPSGVRLLPYFDAYVVAGQPRTRLFPPAAAARALVPSGQAGNFPVLLVDGTVAGVWHQRRAGRRIHLTVEPIVPLSARQRRALGTEADRVAAALEGEASLTIGAVTVGAHA